MSIKKHWIWVIGLIIMIIIICVTIIYLNYNAWTIRLEMDNNTLEAIKSIDWKSMANMSG